MRTTLFFLSAVIFLIVHCHATRDSEDIADKSNVVSDIFSDNNEEGKLYFRRFSNDPDL